MSQTIVPTWLSLLIIALTVAVLGYVGWGPNSQHGHLKAVNSWIGQLQPSWGELTAQHPALKSVRLFAFTGDGGSVGILMPKLDPADELALYQFVLSSNPPRPIHVQHMANSP